jgi:hypothetical protein
LLIAGGTYLLAARKWNAAHLGRVLTATVIAVATAFLLAAVQLLPTLELLAHAVRGGLTLEQTLPGNPTWAIAASVLLASGPAVVLLGAAWLDRERQAWVIAATVLLIAAGLIGLGTPAYSHFFFHLPGIDRFRIPNRMWHFATLALALLAAIGLDAMRATDRSPRARLAVTGLLAGIAAAAWALGARPNGYGTVLVIVAILLPLVRPAPVAWALVALVVFERFAQPENAAMIPQHNDAAFFRPPAFVDFIKGHGNEGRTVIVKDWARRYPMMEKAGSLWGFDVAQDFEPLAPRAYHEFLLPLERYNTDAPLFWGRFTPPSQHVPWRVLDLMAVRWVAVDAAVPWRSSDPERFRLAYEDATARVYENVQSLPRAFLVDGVVVAAEAGAALAQVHAPSFDPHTTVVVDRPIRWRSQARRDDLGDAVRIQTIAPEEIRLDVVTPRPSVLVLADLFWPGWKVAVDGDERTLHRANYLFRGVALEAGTHHVRFWYAPSSIRWGILLTGSTAAALLLAGAPLLRRRLRP